MNALREATTKFDFNDYETTMTENELLEASYLITQYCNYGECTEEAIAKYVYNECDQYINVYDISNYLTDNNYEPVFTVDEFDIYLNGVEPYDILRMVYYGDIDLSKDLFTFDGYGNLKSIDADYLYEWYGYDTFAWLADNGEIECDVFDNVECLINLTNELLRKGW